MSGVVEQLIHAIGNRFDIIGCLPVALLPVVIDNFAFQNGDEPGLYCRSALKALKRLYRRYQSLLHQILGRLRIPDP
jgi:hypothetical protein